MPLKISSVSERVMGSYSATRSFLRPNLSLADAIFNFPIFSLKVYLPMAHPFNPSFLPLTIQRRINV